MAFCIIGSTLDCEGREAYENLSQLRLFYKNDKLDNRVISLITGTKDEVMGYTDLPNEFYYKWKWKSRKW